MELEYNWFKYSITISFRGKFWSFQKGHFIWDSLLKVNQIEKSSCVHSMKHKMNYNNSLSFHSNCYSHNNSHLNIITSLLIKRQKNWILRSVSTNWMLCHFRDLRFCFLDDIITSYSALSQFHCFNVKLYIIKKITSLLIKNVWRRYPNPCHW